MSSESEEDIWDSKSSDAEFESESTDGDILNYEEGSCYEASVGNAAVITVACPSLIGLRGCISLQVLRGSVNVSGYWINRNHGLVPLYSPASNSALTLFAHDDGAEFSMDDFKTSLDKVISNNIAREEICNRVETSNCVVMVWHGLWDYVCESLIKYTIKDLFRVPKREKTIVFKGDKISFPNCAIVDARQPFALQITERWHRLLSQLVQTYEFDNPVRVVVCGGKKSGKSTLLRYLVNNFLNKIPAVYVLDADPGQSEFLPPGCVSLVKVTEPLLGPPYTHHTFPVKCCFVGGPEVSRAPEHYVECIQHLFETYEKEFSQLPLFVNTMGWTRGIGLSILFDTIFITKPTHIVQLANAHSQKWNLRQLTPEYLTEESGWMCSAKNSLVPEYQLVELVSTAIESDDKYTGEVSREFNLIAYFSKFGKSDMLLHGQTPYRVSWSSVAVHVCNEAVPNSQILYALNGAVVALCICDPSQFAVSDDEFLPKFMNAIPVCDCVGYGIIRGICVEKKLFYIITPLRYSVLCQVNALLRGAIQLPKSVLIQQRTNGRIPYCITTPVTKTVVGNKAVKRRSFKMRGGPL